MMCFVFDLPVTLSGEERGFPIEGFLSLFVFIIYNDIGGKSIGFVQFQRFYKKICGGQAGRTKVDLSAEGRQQSGQGKALRLPELFQ